MFTWFLDILVGNRLTLLIALKLLIGIAIRFLYSVLRLLFLVVAFGGIAFLVTLKFFLSISVGMLDLSLGRLFGLREF